MQEHSAVIITHGPLCLDGAVAAWSLAKYIKRKNSGRAHNTHITIHSTDIRDFHNDKNMPDLADKDVYIVDYSYPADILLLIRSRARHLTVIDHHITFQDHIKELPPDHGITIIYDDKYCATELVWDYLRSIEDRPWFIKHVRDRDLWLWEDPNSKVFCAKLFSDGYTADVFEKLYNMSSVERSEYYAASQTLFYENQIATKKISETAKRMILHKNDIKYTVVAVESALLRSEIGDYLVSSDQNIETNATIAVIYRFDIAEKMWYISLRSNNENGPNVGKICQLFGGGGQMHAAGFSYNGPISDILSILE